MLHSWVVLGLVAHGYGMYVVEGKKYAEARALRTERLELLNENSERLKAQEEENVQVEAKTVTIERMLQKKRLEMMSSQEKLQTFKDQLEILKGELGEEGKSRWVWNGMGQEEDVIGVGRRERLG